jgi:hypothetical protein
MHGPINIKLSPKYLARNLQVKCPAWPQLNLHEMSSISSSKSEPVTESLSYTKLIILFNTQNVMETRLAKLYYFEVSEFENDRENFSSILLFELQ